MRIELLPRYILEVVLLPILTIVALLCRWKRKKIDVGLGPEPLVNNVYHKMALEMYGYGAETFVSDVYFITDKFDIRGDQFFRSELSLMRKPLKYLASLCLFVMSLWKYKCIYMSFNGGPLGLVTAILWRIEPFLYKLGGVKTVVLPYGGDVQEMSRSPNLLFKHVYGKDYPAHRFQRWKIASRIDLWTCYADHIIGGCEWVDYMYHWDTLMLAHFSIDVDVWKPTVSARDGSRDIGDQKIRVLHAPNHRAIKGTRYFMGAINELIEEGLDIELVMLEGVSNDRVREVMASVDVVADQLIVGWYAMFAVEAMAMEKPVLCFLREDLEHLYVASGLVAGDEIPIIHCSPLTVKETIRELVLNRDKLSEIGKRSREYVIKHHSTMAVGKVFEELNRSIGLKPKRAANRRQA
jgi:glycosyltransferase involved in cell wall biosynthesis